MLADLNLASIVAGVAAAFSVAAFYFFINASAKEAQVKRRMESVKNHRSALRAAQREFAAARAGKGKKKAESLAMSKALGKLNLEARLQDQELKLRMLRAGKRDRSDMVAFVFKQIALPPILAIVFFFAYQFVVKPAAFDLVQVACVVLAGLIVGYILPGMALDKATEARKQAIVAAYPDALDLLTICVESGMSVEQSFNKVSSELGAGALELSEELQVTTAELSYLGDRRQALENLALRTDLPQVKSITSALIQAEKYGTPVGKALRVISEESRYERMSRAETKAAALPAQLTVPMMLFFVPVLFVVILSPAILQVMDNYG